MALSAQIVITNALLGTGGQPNQVTVQFTIIESDTTLPHQYVAGVVDWGDGTLELSIGPVASPATLTTTHAYPNGSFLVKLIATNFRNPIPDQFVVSAQVQLASAVLQVNQSPVLLAPILPADVGYPNVEQWNFDVSTDLKVLVSNVKMILIVEPGERLMMPEYGAALRQFLFDPLIDSGLDQDIEAEVRRAIATWEPRVLIDQVNSAVDTANRKINLDVFGISRLNQESFQLNLELER